MRRKGRIKTLALRILMATMIGTLLLAGIVAADTVTVDKGGTADYTTIQGAIDAASVGDEIHVNSGTYYENVNVNKEKLYLKGVDTGTGKPIVNGGYTNAIRLWSNGITIEGFNVISNNKRGIDAEFVSESVLINNDVSGGPYGVGIFLWFTGNSNVSRNNVTKSNQGILLSYTESELVVENNLSTNNYGIVVEQSRYNLISNNNASGNKLAGIYLAYANFSNLIANTANMNNGPGIRMSDSYNNTLIGNTANSNICTTAECSMTAYQSGIVLKHSNDNSLTGNNASDNHVSASCNGVLLFDSSSHNTLSLNNFINSGNVCDQGSNQWDNNSKGNYYSDYLGTDSDDDGIGDTWYTIPSGSNVDRFPLMIPYTKIPIPSTPDEIEVGEGHPDTPVSAEITAAFVEAYNREVNGGEAKLGKPTSYVKFYPDATGYYAQEFPGVTGIPGGIIMYNPSKKEAYYLHGAIWLKYESLPDKSMLGALSQDETEAGTSSQGTTGRYSAFDNGRIHWVATSPKHPEIKDKSFVTYGTLDAKYTALGGTNHWLGFPVEDQKIFEGHNRQKFEGGWIYWNEISATYEEATKLVAIVPIEFNDKTHTADQNAENLKVKAKLLADYYYQQSYKNEKIGYKVYVNPYENGGWHKIQENYADIEKGIHNSYPENLKCIDCSLPENPGPDWYIWLVAMNGIESNIKLQNSITVGSYMPENYDIGMVVFPFKGDQGSAAWPHTSGGAIWVDAVQSYGTWAHEWGHRDGLLGEFDVGLDSFYLGLGNWDIMGIQSCNPWNCIPMPPPPVSVVNKEVAGWIHTSNVMNDFKEYEVSNINDDTIAQKGSLKFGIEEQRYYIFEGRYPPDGVATEDGFSSVEMLEPQVGVEIYQLENGKTLSLLDADIPFISGKSRVSMILGEKRNIASDKAQVVVKTKDDGKLYVDINELTPMKVYIWGVGVFIELPKPISETYALGDSTKDIDTDLYVISNDGRKVGMDYDTKEYLNQIEGANASGNYKGGGFEWISVPSDVSATPYVTLTQDLKDILANNSNMKVKITSTLTVYDEVGNSITSIPVVTTVTADNMDSDLTLAMPTNITFLPPLSETQQYNLTDSTEFPIRFTAKNSTTNEFITDETANVTVANSTGYILANFDMSNGLNIDTALGEYRVNFNATSYPEFVFGETYTVRVTAGPSDKLTGYATSRFRIDDAIAPTTTISVTGNQAASGWFNSSVEVSLNAADNAGGSGVKITEYSLDNNTWNVYTVPFNMNNEGSTTIYFRSVDNAGNTEATKNYTVNIDTIAPDATINTPINGETFILNQPVLIDWQAKDLGAGIEPISVTVPNGTALDTSTRGLHTFTIKVADKAGNEIVKTVTYNVIYYFGGILQPINPNGTSVFNINKNIPAKFQLLDYYKQPVPNAIVHVLIEKVSNVVDDTVNEAATDTVATIGGAAKYIPEDGMYMYGIKTTGYDPGKYNITIAPDDDTKYVVTIGLR